MTSFIPPEVPPEVPSEITQPQPLQPEPLSPPIPQPEALPRRLPGWRLWIPLALQSVLILATPVQNAYTYVSGTTVTLQTVPVDPYDLLRGYSQTLSYDISDQGALSKLPGGTWLSQQPQGQDTNFYVVLQAPASANTPQPQAWKPVKISRDRPTDLADNQVALKGKYNGWNITYGLETYYMPENRRNQINDDIRQTQSQSQQAFKVDIKVDSNGNAVLTNLWVSDRKYD
ncbi:MAG: GDYXXLXY domain-containing protein [Oscillatoriophycideae cyanobacterium NC_groundwater_1537_Pr4_S-0.65um_50_18]|nr:GDYXXLXY domain-containing protein [Oscillatoriophycideae cyanobacterium NC_groundwater_1537_Pr4_S-0.65um_50_18]